jgi:hypothetical protein
VGIKLEQNVPEAVQGFDHHVRSAVKLPGQPAEIFKRSAKEKLRINPARLEGRPNLLPVAVRVQQRRALLNGQVGVLNVGK